MQAFALYAFRQFFSSGHKIKKLNSHYLILMGLVLCSGCFNAFAEGAKNKPLTLEQAIVLAHQHDPWMAGSRHKQRALKALSDGATALPNPKLSFSLVNLPSESFSFHQEAMTQVKVGVSQMLPRGDSLDIKQRQLQHLSEQQPWRRLERQILVERDITQRWLAAFQAHHTIELIEQDRELFQHLADVAQSNYASGLGKTRQQDVVRAQLELTRLEDRLTLLQEQLATNQVSLTEWLVSEENIENGYPLNLDHRFPKVKLKFASLMDASWKDKHWLQVLRKHPVIKNLDLQVMVGKQEVELANQNYKPQWSLNASYSYRADDAFGRDRADFFSIGAGVEIPLFSSRREDSKVQAAKEQTEEVKTEKRLLLRQLLAGAKSSTTRLKQLNKRYDLFEGDLLSAVSEQAEASLTAYTNDEGDFTEVVRARIAELNTRIEAFEISIQRLHTIAQINYYLAGIPPNYSPNMELTDD